MASSPVAGRWSIEHSIVWKLVLYYGLLALAVIALWWLLPGSWQAGLREAASPLVGTTATLSSLVTPNVAPPRLGPGTVVLMALLGSVAALALSLPVSWVYMATRHKKGYSQSVVHTLVLLPVVVAMVAALVRNSVALAFSIAGIVAAVRFRTTLEDSRDAVFVFLVMAVGLACGVQLEVAVVLSVLFVVVALVLWYTDYARTPPALEGQRAERHLRRVLALANRTSQFVARLDREILESLAPAQLEALQRRLEKRRKELIDGGDVNGDDEGGPRFDGRITVTASEPDGAESVLQSLLDALAKRWKLIRVERDDGAATLVYAVRPKKGSTLAALAERIQQEGQPYVSRVEVEQWQ
ncbi:MAG TPA: DUF4956 domain-containing protein [Gemmatimonadaceae bacterium]|nr:DUF4956 domain-containing protein [Gemmatimonadaceae bacterium]